MTDTMRYLDLDRERKSRRRQRLKKIGLVSGLVLVVFLIGGLVLWKGDFLMTLLRPISFVAQLVNPVRLKEDNGRVNVLVLGLDSRVNGGLLNTDTILVGSFSLAEGDPVLISIPRDFFVAFSSGGQGKINTAYARVAVQSDGTIDEEKGVAAAKAVVEETLGIPLHYWAVVDFEGFKEVINILGGVEVCVEHTFDDFMYPVPGKEKAPLSQRYEHLHFDAGCQLMDGDRALKYSRSRMGTAGEGSDFSRIRRQQKVILAVKEKVFSLSLIFEPVKLIGFYNKFTETIKTDASFGEAQRALELLYDLQEEDGVRSLVLDPGSGLTRVGTAAEFGGAYVLLPKGGGLAAIHEAVQEILFSPAEGTASE